MSATTNADGRLCPGISEPRPCSGDLRRHSTLVDVSNSARRPATRSGRSAVLSVRERTDSLIVLPSQSQRADWRSSRGGIALGHIAEAHGNAPMHCARLIDTPSSLPAIYSLGVSFLFRVPGPVDARGDSDLIGVIRAEPVSSCMRVGHQEISCQGAKSSSTADQRVSGRARSAPKLQNPTIGPILFMPGETNPCATLSCYLDH